jgi:hypothetical protein
MFTATLENTMSRRTLIALAVTLPLILGANAHAELVTNGGFESNDGTANFTGWSTSGTGILVDNTFQNTGTFDAAFTASSADLNPGILSQSITTTPGTSYHLSFAILDQAGDFNDTFTVTFGGFSATITGDTAAAPGNLPSFYTAESFDIDGSKITGTSTDLTFQGVQDVNNNASNPDWNLDDVSLTEGTAPTPIPEPSTIAVLCAAIIGLCAMRSASKVRSVDVQPKISFS